jgi:2-isopropylmalate synthase
VTNYRDEDLIELAEKTTGLSFSVEVPSKIEAMMAVKCQSNVYTTSVARRIKVVRGIAEVCEITGDFDIEVRILADSTQHLNECLEKIRSIEGVEVTETRLVLKRFPSKESPD